MTIPALISYPLPDADSLPQNKVSWQLEPRRAVLLIHDMQDYFVAFYGEHSPLMQELQGQIVALKRWCREHGVPVVYTAQPSEQTLEQRALLNDMWGPGLTAADPRQQQIVASLAPEAQDTVLVKWRYSAFQRSDLEQRLHAWGRDQLLICGVYAHIGCLMTAADAFMRDVQPFLVADAVADFSAEQHRMALQYVATRCGAVISRDQVLRSSDDVTTFDGLRARLATWTQVPVAEFDADENLMDYGLDSIRVMSLVSEWKSAGIAVAFEDLARRPSLNGWWALLPQRRDAPAQRQAA